MTAPSYEDCKRIGDLFYKAKKWEQALKAYNDAGKVDTATASADHDLQFKLGETLFRLDRIDESIDAYEQCIAHNEEHSTAWINMAACHQVLENWEEARDAYDTASILEPLNNQCWEGLALCAEKLDDNQLRIKAVESLARLNPESAYWLNEVGRAHIRSKEPSGAWRALAAWLESARLGNDACHPNNAAIGYRKLNRWLDAADAYRESLHRTPGYEAAVKGLEEIRQLLESLSKKIHAYTPQLQRCKEPYERYLNPFEILAINGPLTEKPEGNLLRKLKQRVIQQIQLNDGRADWLSGADLGESRIRQVLDELDAESNITSEWHWIIYQCKELNKFLSLGDPSYFAFFNSLTDHSPQIRPPYWQLRDTSRRDEAFFAFIHTPFLGHFESLIIQALDLNDPKLVQALSSGRLPAIDAFDYFRRANQWLEEKTNEITRCGETLLKGNSTTMKMRIPEPLASIPVELINALPEECKAARTKMGRALRSAAIDLHNSHGLTAQALEITTKASELLVDDSLTEQLKKDKLELQRLITIQLAKEAKWNRLVHIESDTIEITKDFVRMNKIIIPEESILGIAVVNSRPWTHMWIVGTDQSIDIKFSPRSLTQLQAIEKFTAVLEGVIHHVLPGLVDRYSNSIASGQKQVGIGNLVLTQNGIQFQTGRLWWKSQQTIPYEAWQLSNKGKLIEVKAINQWLRFEIPLDIIPNALILIPLVEAIKELQSQSK